VEPPRRALCPCALDVNPAPPGPISLRVPDTIQPFAAEGAPDPRISMTDQVMMGPLALRAVAALADAYACCGDEHRDFGCFHIGRRVTTDLDGV
jgi:hypothetical protein